MKSIHSSIVLAGKTIPSGNSILTLWFFPEFYLLQHLIKTQNIFLLPHSIACFSFIETCQRFSINRIHWCITYPHQNHFFLQLVEADKYRHSKWLKSPPPMTLKFCFLIMGFSSQTITLTCQSKCAALETFSMLQRAFSFTLRDMNLECTVLPPGIGAAAILRIL